MSKGLKVAGIVIGVVVLLFALRIIDTYVYPFKKASPNYSDVEAAFAKLQFPNEWQELSSSENKGLYGRNCPPVDNSGCFSKSKVFRLSEATTIDEIQKTIISSGLCTGINLSSPIYKDEQNPTYNYECSVDGGLTISGTYRGPDNEASVRVKTY